MIQMSKQTDYGIVLLTCLVADAEGETYSARELARETRIPLPMVSKILKILAREGLLLSQRGPKGGYSLARPPERISVAEVIDALEGPIALTECAEEGSDCRHELFCPVRENWQKINLVVRDALQRITLSDMAGPLPRRTLVSLDKRREMETVGLG